MTQVVYNGIQLRECNTKIFRQDIVRDDSNTDVFYSRFHIRVISTMLGFLTSSDNENPIIVSETSGTAIRGSVVQQMQYISKRLWQNGKDFYFWLPNAPEDTEYAGADSQTVMLIATGDDSDPDREVPVNPLDSGGTKVLANTIYDPDNGPKVEDVQVEQIYGNRSIRVSFEIVVCRKLCVEMEPDPYPQGEPTEPHTIKQSDKVLSNRWFLTESKDASWRTTRTLQGTLRTKSKTHFAHLFRHLVVPPLLKGYRRVSQRFASDPTDLVLKYRIEDRQEHEAPPQPAIEWSGTVTEAAGPKGTTQHSEISLRLTGPPGVDKQQLIGAAGQVVKQRIAGLQKDPADGEDGTATGWLDGSAIVDVIGQPTIEMYVRWRQADIDDLTKLRSRIKAIGEPLSIDGYDPKVWPVPLFYDRKMALVGTLSCYLQNPCSQYHGISSYPEGYVEADGYDRPENDTDSPPDDEDIRIYPSIEPLVIESDDGYGLPSSIDPDLQKMGNPFTFISVESRYEIDDGVVQLPYANEQPGYNGETCALIKLHAGTAKRHFRMEAARLGKTPVAPKLFKQLVDPNGITEKRGDVMVGNMAPEHQADAVTREFRVFIECTYLLTRPPEDDEKFRMAISPIDTTEEHVGPENAPRYIAGDDLFDSELIEWRE